MFNGKMLKCPVCATIFGRLTPDEVCSFVCRECEWIYSWDRKGKLMPPVKLDNKKSKSCECQGCKARDAK